MCSRWEHSSRTDNWRGPSWSRLWAGTGTEDSCLPHNGRNRLPCSRKKQLLKQIWDKYKVVITRFCIKPRVQAQRPFSHGVRLLIRKGATGSMERWRSWCVCPVLACRLCPPCTMAPVATTKKQQASEQGLSNCAGWARHTSRGRRSH